MKRHLLLTASLLALFSANARAEESLAVSAGGYNVFDNDDNSTWLNAEYRGKYLWNQLAPIAGVAGNTDGALYGYAGLMYDWNVAGNVYLIPSIAAGAYAQGDSKDLGGAVEFRSSIEAAYRFNSGLRVGVALQHLSNAHIYDKNPGTEMLVGTVTVPIP